MKWVDTLKLLFNRFFRNVKNGYFIVSLSFFVMLLCFIFNLRDNFLYYITHTITENINARTVIITANPDYEDYGLEKIRNINNIEYINSSKYDSISVYSDFKNEYFDGGIEFILGNEYTLPKNIIGRTINEKDSKVAICPKNFYPSSDSDKILVDNSKVIDGRNLLNKKFKVTYNSFKLENGNVIKDQEYSEEFKIIGIYDSSEMFNLNNVCYIAYDDMVRISDIKDSINEGVIHSFSALVNKEENVDKVISELKEVGIDATPKITLDVDFFENIFRVCNGFVIIIVVLMFIIVILYIKKKVIQDTSSIGYMKCIGFNKKQLILIFLVEYLLVTIISLIFGFLMFLIIFGLLKLFLINPYLNMILNVKIFFNNFVYISLFIICILLIIGFIYTYKVVNKNILKLLEAQNDK